MLAEELPAEVDDLEKVINRIIEDAKKMHDQVIPVDVEKEGLY